MEWNLSMTLFLDILNAESDTPLVYHTDSTIPLQYPSVTDIGTNASIYNAQRSPLQILVHYAPQNVTHNHGICRLACHGPSKTGGA